MDKQGLRIGLITERIKQTVGNVASLAAALNVHPSTVGRWLNPEAPKFPRTEDAFMGLAAELNLDPVLLWDYDESTFPLVCQQVMNAMSTGKWSSFIQSLAFLDRYIRPKTSWPPAHIAERFPCGKWHELRFCHAPRIGRDYYAKIAIDITGTPDQVWHIAYRDAGTILVPLWWHYGFTWRATDALRLFTFHGPTMKTPCAPDADPICMETWFGRGAAEFCVASLHPFEATLVDDVKPGTPTVRFGFAGEVSGDGR